MTDEVTIPGIPELLLPMLRSAQDLGGSATRAELLEHFQGLAGLTDEQIAVTYTRVSGKRNQSKVLHRAEWTVYWLNRIGVLQNRQRGVWTITSRGIALLDMEEATAVAALTAAYEDSRRQLAAAKKVANKVAEPDGKDDGDADLVPGEAWKSVLLEALKKMTPTAFERLAMRILREAGFQRVEVVGRSDDGGLDGVGLYKMSLVSFPIYFQCKRYAGGVGAGAVRDFRGAMAGRGDKGLMITTGAFTPGARAEATRDGAAPVDLIDGDELCGLFLEYRIGVEVAERMVTEVTVDRDFFTKI